MKKDRTNRPPKMTEEDKARQHLPSRFRKVIPSHLYSPEVKVSSRKDLRRDSQTDRKAEGKRKLAVYQSAKRACV